MIVLVGTLCILGPNGREAYSAQSEIDVLRASPEWEHVTFEDKRPTLYKIDDDGVFTANVRRSASFVLVSFADIVPVATIEWEWRNTGNPNLESARHEESKRGDDALLRIGVVMHGEEPGVIPIFAPGWIKQVRELLNFPTNAMVFLISGSKHEDGESWTSPYFRRITHQAVTGIPLADGWNRSSFTFAEGTDVVAIWLMADGDDTEAQFDTQLRNLKLKGVAENGTAEFENQK